MFNRLVINPAYAGLDDALSATFVSRFQWTSVEGAPTTHALSLHAPIKKKKFGVGLTIIKDAINIHDNLVAQLSYAYHLQVGERSWLSAGLQAGVQHLRSDYPSINTGTDPALNSAISATFVDFGTGIYFKSPRFHAGLSVPEIMPRRVRIADGSDVYFRRTNFLAFALYKIRLSEAFDLEPNMLVKVFPDLPASYDANVNIVYRDAITLGFSYRKDESVDFLLRAQLTSQLAFGYAYDYPFSNAVARGSGSHELMLNYVFKFVRSGVATPR